MTDSASPSPAPLPAGPLLVRSPNWLGDAVMALGAVRNLKAARPGEPLVVAAPAKLAALWEAFPPVDRVIALERPRNLWATARQLREGKFAAAVLLPNSLRAAAEVWLAGIPERIGYARDGRGWLLTRAVPVPPRQPTRLHQRLYYLDLASALGAPDDPTPALLQPRGPREKTPVSRVIAVCPGAEYGPAKRWPVERFAEAARELAGGPSARIVILGAPSDEPGAVALAALLPEAENRAGRTTLAEFISALADATIVLCNDSGAMHVAAALGTPTVAIFGSTEPLLTGPTGPRVRVLRHHVPCSPCFRRECPLDFACMNGVTPEMAIAAGGELLRA